MKNKAKKIVLVGMFAALIIIGTFLKLDLGIISITLQLQFVILAGIFLGPIYGPMSVIIYILLGLIGLPVFAKGGGYNYVLQPSFGFILGFILTALVSGLISKYLMEKPNIIKYTLGNLMGMILSYFIGLPYMYFILNLYLNKNLSIEKVISLGFTPFIVKDLILTTIVLISVYKIIPTFKKLNLI